MKIELDSTWKATALTLLGLALCLNLGHDMYNELIGTSQLIDKVPIGFYFTFILLVYLVFVSVLSLRKVGKREIEGLKEELEKALKDKAIAEGSKEVALKATLAITEVNKSLNSKVTDAERKATALEGQATELTRLRQNEAVVAKTLATVKAELAVALKSEATASDSLATANQRLSTAKVELANCTSHIKELTATVDSLTPYHTFFTHFDAYKRAESVKNSSKATEGEKREAKKAFDQAKADWMSFYELNKQQEA